MEKKTSLAGRVLNGDRMAALCVGEEIAEYTSALKGGIGIFKGKTILKRSFNQFGERFWRVSGPANHPMLGSDLSVRGLKEWGLL